MSDETAEALGKVRQEIDDIDAQLISLLSRRAQCAIRIGEIKGRDQKPFFTPERERDIYESLNVKNPGPLSSRQLVSIYREIISAARAAEKPLVAAYWGPAGTFTHLATLKTFGGSSTLQPQDSIQDVFLAVEHVQADYGVVPVENSVAGVVPETLDMFPQTNVKICAETYVAIHHHLVSTSGDLNDVKRVFAGPQPAQQCRRWLRANLPMAEIVEVVPTARAAEQALSEPNSAAICNALGAETVGIPIVVDHIEDNPHNRTRFLIVGSL